ncbi:MAG: hypothetical protein JXM79_00360 [Sedimentisphaerales bacterium]|nr:hypothetical protein [Sedimentisphaerales bacterium]
MNHIEKTIKTLDDEWRSLNAKLIELHERAERIKALADQLRETFKEALAASPGEPATRRTTSQMKRKRPPKLTPSAKPSAAVNNLATRVGVRKGRAPFSKYKGVTKGQKKPYRASWWDGPAKKNRRIGEYEIEERAAAEAAKARGEMDLYRELMAIIEQIENNPDRPDVKPPKRSKGLLASLADIDKPTSMRADLESYYE